MHFVVSPWLKRAWVNEEDAHPVNSCASRLENSEKHKVERVRKVWDKIESSSDFGHSLNISKKKEKINSWTPQKDVGSQKEEEGRNKAAYYQWIRNIERNMLYYQENEGKLKKDVEEKESMMVLHGLRRGIFKHKKAGTRYAKIQGSKQGQWAD